MRPRNAGPVQEGGEQVFYVGRPTRLAKLHVYFFGLLMLLGAPLVWAFKPGFLEGQAPGGFVTWGGIVAWVGGFLGFVLLVRAEFQRLTTKYTITNVRLIRRDGILRHHTQYVLFNKVERIEVNQGILGRLLGIGDIFLDTGEDVVVLDGIRDPRRVETGIAQTLSQRRGF